MMIADLTITTPFTVYDINTGHYVYTWNDIDGPGDIPPDIAILPVLGIRMYGGMMYIDSEVQ